VRLNLNVDKKEIFFINGMPRSGSTLFCNILAQNPAFHVTATSGLPDIIHGIQSLWKNNPVIKAAEPSDKQLVLIRDLFQSYHLDNDRPIVFNKSRAWAGMIELVENALDRPIKIISTTRKLTSVLASLEKLYRREIKCASSLMQPGPQMGTIEGRVNTWAATDGIVGETYNALFDACIRGHKDKFHFIDYDDLTHTPDTIIRKVYKFLDKPYFKHNFNNVEQYTQENDAEHGFADLHTIRPVIEPQEDDSEQILGPMYEQYVSFTYDF